MRPLFYRRDGTAVIDPSPDEVRTLWSEANRRIAYTKLSDGTVISTVCLVLDHSWGGERPLIFETLVFGPDGSADDSTMERYATEAEAKMGHDVIVQQEDKPRQPTHSPEARDPFLPDRSPHVWRVEVCGCHREDGRLVFPCRDHAR